MASRSIWKGTLSFGMVCLPIKVFNGITDTRKETAMVNLHASCGSRLKQPKYCPKCEQFLETEEKPIKGYEIGEDQYIILTDDDLGTLPLPTTSSVSITNFAKEAFSDPRWVKDSYFITPDKHGEKPFTLFLKAMEMEGVVGISKITFRSNSKETLCIVRPYNGLLLLQSLYWPEQLKATDEFRVAVPISDKEIDMGCMLVRAMTNPFNPEDYTDNYAEAFGKLIEAKMNGTELALPVSAEKQETEDLFDALEKSLEAVGAK